MTSPISAAPPQFEEHILPPSDGDVLPNSLAALQQETTIHRLTVDDLLHRNQRAKFETFDSYTFLVWLLPATAENETTELHFLITSRRIALVATERPSLTSSWAALFFPEGPPPTQAATLVTILRSLVRTLEERLTHLTAQVERLEQSILEGGSQPREILALKRTVREFGARAQSARDALTDLIDHFQFSGEERLLARRCQDRLSRTLSHHDLLATQLMALFDVYWGAVGTQTNVQLKRLTVMTTLCLPIALWSSFFGMNFEALPFRETWFFLMGMALMALSGVVVLAYLFISGVVTRPKR